MCVYNKSMETEAEKQLAVLVGMRTLSDNLAENDKALDYLEDYFKHRGLFCARDKFQGHGTLIASTRADNGMTPTVLLSAHVDVVGGTDQVFTLRLQDGKLIGRGVYDMKFSIAGYMQLVDDWKDKLANYDFSIVITTDEEYGGSNDVNGTHRLVEAGLDPKVCIMPDSTAPNWDIETVAKGYWRFDLTAHGKSSHGSRPWDGDSASVKLIDALQELKAKFKDQNIKTDSLNIAKLSGGDQYNQVPATTSAWIEIRYTSQQNLAENKKFIDALCKKYDLTIDEKVVGPLVLTDLKHPLVEPFLQSVKKVTGRKPEPFTSCAASDAPYLFEKGINCIISCPKGGAHHSENEWIDRESFLHFVPILKDYLEQVAKV